MNSHDFAGHKDHLTGRHPAQHRIRCVDFVHLASLAPWPYLCGLQHPGARRRHEAEALSTAKALKTAGWNFSVGLGQNNVVNFSRLGLTLESAFQPCTNLAAMQTILAECFHRARAGSACATTDQAALQRALSCYYSGTFTTGFRHGYVRKVGTTLKSFRSAPTRQELFTSLGLR
jgi:Transglycosylase SLT domain